MMVGKRRYSDGHSSPPAKRPRLGHSIRGNDLLSNLSDELLLYILSALPLSDLVAVAPISRRLYRLTCDSQLWRSLYYERFILPRAMRIPAFRDGLPSERKFRLHYSGRRSLWADSKRGVITNIEGPRRSEKGKRLHTEKEHLDWKRQYRIRLNWERGRCAVKELRLDSEIDTQSHVRDGRSIFKAIEGMAITADETLRVWDLRTREMLAQAPLGSDTSPSCIAVDDLAFGERDMLDIALGFQDGSFGIWRFETGKNGLSQAYRHEKSSNGALISMAFSFPYLLTATESVLISLYTFQQPTLDNKNGDDGPDQADVVTRLGSDFNRDITPLLLTSLRSHTSRPPLALSIRKIKGVMIATIVYIFSSRQGWSIGMQDLHVTTSTPTSKAIPEVRRTRLAYSAPIDIGTSTAGPSTPTYPVGPTTLSYSHPYVIAGLPDNTLVLHLCKSSASTLSISPAYRLWGHTSAITAIEITARGKAVSLSSKGKEMRAWELEGAFSGRSVEIRPEKIDDYEFQNDHDLAGPWVGFDEERISVLKSHLGESSLVVYDFT